MKAYFFILSFDLLKIFICCVLLTVTLFLFSCTDENEWEDLKLKKRLSAFPDHLIADVEQAFGSNEHIRYVFEYNEYEWLKRTNIYCFYGTKDHAVVYSFKDFGYTRLNCKEGVKYINEIIQDYQFSSSDFEDNQSFTSFLNDCIVAFYHDPRGLIMTERLLGSIGPNLQPYLNNDNKEEEYREFFFNPKPNFINGKWDCKWNVLNNDGSVSEFQLSCEYDPEKQSNTITSINIKTIKPMYSYVFPYMG